MSSVRKISPYSTDQGTEGICWAHSMTRLISRLIKIHFGERHQISDEFMFDEGELLDEYYDTVKCSTENTIFHCIAHAQDIHERKGKLFSMHKSLKKMINWESENLSALLFHFILNWLKNKYGCGGLKQNSITPIFYFLKLLLEHITEEKIKDILNYYDFKMPSFPPPPEPPLPEGWKMRMSRSKNLPYWLNTLTGEKTWKEPNGVVPAPLLAARYHYPASVQSTLSRNVVDGGGGLMDPTFQQVQENKVMFSRLIKKLASVFELLRIALEKKTLKINLFTLGNLYDGKLTGDFFQINDKGNAQWRRWLELPDRLWPIRRMWFKSIRQVLEQGLYVLLCIYKHAILITGIEGQFFIVKNSWGSDRDWILPDGFHFIVDNKVSISTLIKQSKTTEIELVYIEFETHKDKIFTEGKLPNKSIIHTLKKTAKRLSGRFNIGGKKTTQNKFKNYYKKL
jgi:hypothetical protein